jgi:PPE-repeat protein
VTPDTPDQPETPLRAAGAAPAAPASTSAPAAPATSAPAATPAPAPASPGFGYLIGPADPGDGPGPTQSDRPGDKAPASSMPAAVAATAVSRDRTQRRRRRQASQRGHGDEFADMNIEVDPDWGGSAEEGDAAVSASERGAGPLGFAGTEHKTSRAAAGLATLTDDEFGAGPREPLMPDTWGDEAEREGA